MNSYLLTSVSKLLRMKDLNRVGVNNWPTLARWIAKEEFPPGRYLAANTRVWTEEEVQAWFDSRPKADPPPEIVKPATLLQEGDGRVGKKDRHQSSTASDSAAQATSREVEE